MFNNLQKFPTKAQTLGKKMRTRLQAAPLTFPPPHPGLGPVGLMGDGEYRKRKRGGLKLSPDPPSHCLSDLMTQHRVVPSLCGRTGAAGSREREQKRHCCGEGARKGLWWGWEHRSDGTECRDLRPAGSMSPTATVPLHGCPLSLVSTEQLGLCMPAPQGAGCVEPFPSPELLWSVLGEARLPLDTRVGVSDSIRLFFPHQLGGTKPLPWMILDRQLLLTMAPRNDLA